MIEKINKLFKCDCGGIFATNRGRLLCTHCGNIAKNFNDIMFFQNDEKYNNYLIEYKNDVILPQLDYLYNILKHSDIAMIHIERLSNILEEINKQVADTNKPLHNSNLNNMYANEMNNDNYIVSSYSQYITTKFGFSESHYSTLLRLVGKLSDNVKILDVGCGLGRTLSDISEFYPHGLVLGCDIQLTKLHLTNRILCGNSTVDYIAIKNFQYTAENIASFNRKNVCLFYCDVNTGLPLNNNSMDVIILSFILGLLNDYNSFLINVSQKIKQNGLLIIADDYGWHSNIRSLKRMVTPDRVDDILKQHGFEKINEMDVPYLGVLSDRVANAHIIRLTKYQKTRSDK